MPGPLPDPPGPTAALFRRSPAPTIAGSGLNELCQLHFDHGLTLTDLWHMFEACRTVTEVDRWIGETRQARSDGEVPLVVLLEALDQLKADRMAVPSVKAARVKVAELAKFTPARLIARLRAVETVIGDRWLRVDESGDVVMHQTAEQIRLELERQIGCLYPTDDHNDEEGDA